MGNVYVKVLPSVNITYQVANQGSTAGARLTERDDVDLQGHQRTAVPCSKENKEDGTVGERHGDDEAVEYQYLSIAIGTEAKAVAD